MSIAALTIGALASWFVSAGCAMNYEEHKDGCDFMLSFALGVAAIALAFAAGMQA